jgi:hypothetical protein
MNGFDRFCAVLAFILGVVFLGLGALGLFLGCSAHFTLPPVLGALPALVGWGIVRPIVVAWGNGSRPIPPRYYPEPLPREDNWPEGS